MKDSMWRLFFIGVLLAVLFLVCSKLACACVGARALALGGAFTGVADDTQATYWNPAGLVIAGTGITAMHTLNLRREFNYDEYVGFSFSKGNVGIGLEYIQADQREGYILKKQEGALSAKLEETYHWWQIGGAYTWRSASIGLNIRYLQFEQSLDISDTATKKFLYLKADDSALALDFGILAQFGPLYKENSRRMFSAGILIQDLNKPVVLNHEHIRNIRPGLGFRPFGNLLFTLEIYDLAKEAFQKPQVRAGLEWISPFLYIPGEVALRGGIYHINDKQYRAFTGGIGYSYPLSHHTSLVVDYAFMWWDKQDTVVHLLSLGYRF